jgi:hypothetical protein
VDTLRIQNVRFEPSDPEAWDTGLLGYVSFGLNDGVRIDGVTLRRTRHGKLSLSFPTKRRVTGKQFFCVRPLDATAHKQIEEQVFQALGLAGEMST